MSYHPRQIPLVGGPLNGVCHELWGNLMPERIGLPLGLPSKDGLDMIAWYAIKNRKGLYLYTKKDEK